MYNVTLNVEPPNIQRYFSNDLDSAYFLRSNSKLSQEHLESFEIRTLRQMLRTNLTRHATNEEVKVKVK